jgi:lipopolysaccharide biosynthesis protein
MRAKNIFRKYWAKIKKINQYTGGVKKTIQGKNKK